jgi:DNA polymerase (family 10)
MINKRKIQRRIVFKKGKFIVTRKGDFILNLSEKILKEIKPFCKKIEIVGSIRRKEKNPVDIDLVLIPKNKLELENFIKEKLNWKFLQGGEHESTWKIDGVKVELYYTVEEEWGAALLAYSSKIGAGIGLRLIAKRKGMKLNNHGLFDKKGRRIAGKTEREIYSALGRKWKFPENR